MVEVEVEEYNDMCVLGFHVYQDVWRPWPVIGEELRCQREEDNIRGPYAVVVIKPCAGIVGNVPCYLSALCTVFS